MAPHWFNTIQRKSPPTGPAASLRNRRLPRVVSSYPCPHCGDRFELITAEVTPFGRFSHELVYIHKDGWRCLPPDFYARACPGPRPAVVSTPVKPERRIGAWGAARST